MGSIIRAADTVYCFRVLRLLTTPWIKMGAYKAGIIDDTGKLIRRPTTAFQKSKYTLLHRFVFNLKKLLNKLPLGKTTIASYLAALYLIKEEAGISDDSLSDLLYELNGIYLGDTHLKESADILESGEYTLLHDIALPKTGEVYALKNSKVIIMENAKPMGDIFGVNIYTAIHIKTKQQIFLTTHDIIK